MQIHSTHKNSSGFTLIELVIAVAVIGILTSVAVLGYNQYKVRAYDAHSKQALRDILLQCNAFWLDQDASQVCNHATVAEVYVASDEIVLKFPAEDLPDLPGGSQGNFCASAQHESSPNTYSIDSASLISEGDCGGAGGSVQTASAGGSVKTAPVREPLKPKDWECVSDSNGPYTQINSPGNKLDGWCVRVRTLPGKPDEPWYYFMDPDGTPYNYADKVHRSHSYPNGWLEAVVQYSNKGNEIIAYDYPGGFSEPASYYTATLANQGKKLTEVDDSREVTFSEWNSKSTEERMAISHEARKQDKRYCQNLQRSVPHEFFMRMESCPDKQLWIP